MYVMFVVEMVLPVLVVMVNPLALSTTDVEFAVEMELHVLIKFAIMDLVPAVPLLKHVFGVNLLEFVPQNQLVL